MGRNSLLRSGLVARKVKRRDGTGRQGWNPQRNAATQVQTEAEGLPRRARVLATGTDRGGRGEGRPLSVEGAKMRVGRGGETSEWKRFKVEFSSSLSKAA